MTLIYLLIATAAAIAYVGLNVLVIHLATLLIRGIRRRCRGPSTVSMRYPVGQERPGRSPKER